VRFDILTLFPEIFQGYVGQSLLKKAIDAGLVEVCLHDIRKWTSDKHNRVDDRPYGGGPGMVLMVQPVVDCVEAVLGTDPKTSDGAGGDDGGHLVLLTPQGRKLDQQIVRELAAHKRLVLLCGRYEGFDERIHEVLRPDEISVGDYVLNGGEVAAMVIVDAVIRMVPGVLGDSQSSESDSFSYEDGRLEFAQYTRPREYRGLTVPEVLLNGNHEEIARWREEDSRRRTLARRTDLLASDAPHADNA
jgi:tRNA (guanine37-N1)-methyltransferase